MDSQKNIFIAFILNLSFSVFEFFGGIFTHSVAIISDSIHDLGDAASIGLSYFLEKKSKNKPDEKYTYGYARFSVLGSIITTMILLVGSVFVIGNAINRIINPTEINYNGMIVFAIIGVIINFAAAFFTRGGNSLNQKAVNLHMLEDVLGWAVVLVGAFVMKLTDWALIDPLMSIGVAVFILITAFPTFKEAIYLFLEKTPKGINVTEIKEHLMEIENVIDVHHIHIRSMDGLNNYATMHIVTEGSFSEVKQKVRDELSLHGITHATLELESKDEICNEINCRFVPHSHGCHCHHHHHHH